jgi:hypothetical protein
VSSTATVQICLIGISVRRPSGNLS